MLLITIGIHQCYMSTIYKNCQQYLLTYMGKSILKLPNFDMKMTKFGYSLQVLLPLCQYISKLICTMYLYLQIHPWCTFSVSIHSFCLFFSLLIYSICQQCSSFVFICLKIFLIVYLYTVSIFLQCWSIYLFSIIQGLSTVSECNEYLSSVQHCLNMSVYRQFLSFFCA